MIQRIQSVYLLLAAILMAVTVYSPLLFLQNADVVNVFECAGIYTSSAELLYSTWGVLLLAILGALLPFVNIFLFKKRKVQMKVCGIVTLLIILFYVAVAGYFYLSKSELGVTDFTISYGIVLPLIALILNVLASIKVKADEKLVQSLNRIR